MMLEAEKIKTEEIQTKKDALEKSIEEIER